MRLWDYLVVQKTTIAERCTAHFHAPTELCLSNLSLEDL